jgi:hypothetical protein
MYNLNTNKSLSQFACNCEGGWRGGVFNIILFADETW